LASGLTLTNPVYTGTLTGGTGVVNIGSGQLYKDSSGNVGIGTTSPAAKLQATVSNGAHRLGTNGSDTNYNVRANAGSNASITWTEDGISDRWTVGCVSGQNYLAFRAGSSNMSNGTEQMRIDSSGRVTTPNVPAFNAYISSGTTVGTAWNNVVYNNVGFNNGSNYNAANGRFTAPVSGYYFVSCALTFTSPDGDGTMAITVNNDYDSTTNVVQISQGDTGSSYSGRGCSGVIYMSAGDFAAVWNFNTSNRVTRTGNPRGGFFSGILIG
jgi:hypothetical protein